MLYVKTEKIMTIPLHSKIMEILKKYDGDKSGSLDLAEFHALVSSILYRT